jgi:hypothetical protein
MIYSGRYTMTPVLLGSRFTESIFPELLLLAFCLLCLFLF